MSDGVSSTTQPIKPVHGLAAIVGFLVAVEFASGVLQGYYTPIYTDIADHLDIADADVNWFEAAQLILSALVVPPLARLGDLVGHKKVLLLSTAVTAVLSSSTFLWPTRSPSRASGGTTSAETMSWAASNQLTSASLMDRWSAMSL